MKKFFIDCLLLFQCVLIYGGSISGIVKVDRVKVVKKMDHYMPLGEKSLSKEIEVIVPVVFLSGELDNFPMIPQKNGLEIRQENYMFRPSVLVIPVGSEVSFPNMDLDFHNVFSYSKTKRFDLGRYPKGETKTVVFDNSGIVNVYCEVHDWMRCSIIVLSNRFYAIPSENGSFILSDVPPGTYTLNIWHMDHKLKSIDVKVEQSSNQNIGTVTLN